jgi:hypothetical protein
LQEDEHRPKGKKLRKKGKEDAPLQMEVEKEREELAGSYQPFMKEEEVPK